MDKIYRLRLGVPSDTTCRMPSDLLTVPEVAEMFGTTRQSIYRWINKGTLTAFRTPGGTMRIRREDAENALRPIEPQDAA